MEAPDDAVPVRVRLLAGGVDLALVLAVTGMIVAPVLKWTKDPLTERVQRVFTKMMTTRRVRAFAWAVRLVSLPARNRRSPGKALVGIRTVDARSGGPVSLRSAVVGQLVELAYEQLVRRVRAPTRRRYERRRVDAERRVQEIRATHAGDSEAIQAATAQVYRDNGVNCLASFATSLPVILVMPLTALLSPRRQTVADRLAGIVVVRDRSRPRAPRRLGGVRSRRDARRPEPRLAAYGLF